MNNDQFQSQLLRVLDAGSLYDVFGAVAPIIDEIEDELATERNEDLLNSLDAIFQTMERGLPMPFELVKARAIISAQILGVISHPLVLNVYSDRGKGVWEAWGNDDEFSQALQASLIGIAFALSKRGDPSALDRLAALTRDMVRRESLLDYTDDCIARGLQPEAFLAEFAHEAQASVGAAKEVVDMGITDAKPGDVLFRNLNLKGFKSFGHTGIYIGPDPDTNENEVANLDAHRVVEMEPWIGNFWIPGILINRRQHCVISTVGGFKAHGCFWGAYSADISPDEPLTSLERQEIVRTALSLVGKCRYGVLGQAYKNKHARQFRCDGFIEHCFESLTPMARRLKHREGLFEGDTYLTMSPNSLRNCLFEKRANF